MTFLAHPIIMLTVFLTAKSLFNAVYSVASLLDKHLCVDGAIIPEMIQKNVLRKMAWVPSKSKPTV